MTIPQEGLEGDRGKDRVQQCHLLKSFQESPHQKLFKYDGKLYYSGYCQLSYVINS